jgi:uncharacterized membrane protein (UPF0127 family)
MLQIFANDLPFARFRAAFFMAAFICYIVPVATIACPFILPTTTIFIKGHKLTAELAFTQKSRSCGLSNRFELSENHGMLFIFPKAKMQTFWMQDTYIPLSIAFINDSGKITNIEKMTPNQTHEQYHSYQPVRYVLEVNQSWFRLHGIKAGDVVEMNLPIILNIQ